MAALRADGLDAEPFTADITDPTQLTEVIARVEEKLGPIEVSLGAQRAYVRQLAAELDGTGVYAGLLAIGSLIEHSAVQEQVDAHPELIPDGMVLPRIGNAELGAAYWRMYTERDTVEVEIGF